MAPGALARLLLRRAPTPRLARPFAAKARASRRLQEPELLEEEENNFAGGEVAAPTEGISKPLAEVLKDLGKRVPDSLVKTRTEDNGFAIKYIPWHIVNKILNIHAPGKLLVKRSSLDQIFVCHFAPLLMHNFEEVELLKSYISGSTSTHLQSITEWSGEVRSIVYSSDGKSVSVVYRVTLHGIDAEIYREATGTASVDDTSYGDPVQKAEAMAFRRACARLGLGLHLYHEDMS